MVDELEAPYRVYQMGGDGHILKGEWIEAEDDAAAIEVAQSMVANNPVELWKGERCIKAFSGESRTDF